MCWEVVYLCNSNIWGGVMLMLCVLCVVEV